MRVSRFVDFSLSLGTSSSILPRAFTPTAVEHLPSRTIVRSLREHPMATSSSSFTAVKSLCEMKERGCGERKHCHR